MATIEIAYSAPEQTLVQQCSYWVGMTVRHALEHVDICQQVDECHFNDGHFSHTLAIFGKKCTLDTVLQPNDRIDILRPLKLSAMEARLLRAKKAQQAEAKR